MTPLQTLPAPRTSPEADPGVAEALALVSADHLVALVQDLVAEPSVTGSDAESAAQHRMERRLRAVGMDTDLWSVDLPATLAHPDFPGLEAARSEAWGLVGAYGHGEGPTVVLNGHVDVVPPGDLTAWRSGPWSGLVRDGRVYGRGACDMKGGLGCQLAAVHALRAAGVRLRGRVLLESVVSEEDGGLGTFATLQRGHTGDLAVICEPTSTDLVTACAGALTFRLVVPGRSVHASVRLEGVDAVEKYVVILAALRRLEAERNVRHDPLMAGYALPYPVSLGTVRAGDWASSVPDLLVAEGRLGVRLGEPVEQARADLEACVAAAYAADPWLRDHPARVEWFGGQFASGVQDPDGPLARLVSGAHAALTGRAPGVRGAPYGSDLRLLAGLGGIPTVHYGPGDVRSAHGPDESVPVQELVTVTRTLVVLLAQTCGTYR